MIHHLDQHTQCWDEIHHWTGEQLAAHMATLEALTRVGTPHNPVTSANAENNHEPQA
ncbi:hypothetical protein HD597_006781 [Nonomuraea thailandensis]|uniref:Uncharacterized protein n=1 Tax=Nonomuraea thailandensis TaxID=1188745 RepID=A0A9X2GQC9_9ACTN|nr:hypothetical protein [Nonomuraea thailandensis]MCP2359761.1 hypothetical protein [Nonomuraea thailandensis]